MLGLSEISAGFKIVILLGSKRDTNKIYAKLACICLAIPGAQVPRITESRSYRGRKRPPSSSRPAPHPAAVFPPTPIPQYDAQCCRCGAAGAARSARGHRNTGLPRAFRSPSPLTGEERFWGSMGVATAREDPAGTKRPSGAGSGSV